MLLTFRQVLSVLSKSSSFSVTTVNRREPDDLDAYKAQLYVQQDIERDLVAMLPTVPEGAVIFLCGSSGDGKSEILKRCHQAFSDRLDFHLDATHSFEPHQTAIEALDEVFDRHSERGRSLLIGINLGMLVNYAAEGAPRHAEIREAISTFLSVGPKQEVRPYRQDPYYFFDFEQYPRFQFSEEGTYSSFAKALMVQLTRPTEDNLFVACARQDEAQGSDLQVVANFNLLAMDSVQEVIIGELFKVRLIKDKFITTRAFLDLLHHLLLGPGYLFDNLYVGEGNELVRLLADFDPAKRHTKALDQFCLRYELGLPEADLDRFLEDLRVRNIHLPRQADSPGCARSMMRLFSVLRRETLGNDYHREFGSEFKDDLLEDFSAVWRLHRTYQDHPDTKRALRKFYNQAFTKGILRYANRNAPQLLDQEDKIFLGTFGGIQVAAAMNLQGDLSRIPEHAHRTTGHFTACLKVNDRPLKPFVVSLNLFELIHKINLGYRPNKYDKNAIVMLDELVDEVLSLARGGRKLHFLEGAKAYQTELGEDGMIAVKGY